MDAVKVEIIKNARFVPIRVTSEVGDVGIDDFFLPVTHGYQRTFNGFVIDLVTLMTPTTKAIYVLFLRHECGSDGQAAIRTVMKSGGSWSDNGCFISPFATKLLGLH